MDYKEIGFKCGVEIHNRLATKGKLFCSCKPKFGGDNFLIVQRKQRVVPGEMGHKDVAAQYEFLRNRTFHYQCYHDETCLVETDSEPPHDVNKEALYISLQVAKILKCDIPDEIHIMRKIVIDGSNTTGFQRTALVGMNGILKTSKGNVGITNVCLEEESAGIVDRQDGNVIYRIDRLGIPLVEIGTAPDVKDPEHAKEVAEKIGMIVRSTGKSQRGLGVTRQDVNVSIKGGERVEIKGVQELDMIPTIIENEVARQKKLVLAESSKEETRVAKEDGTTAYLRPLPGGERMYPETDVEPIVMTKKYLSSIKIPESFESKLKRFGSVLSKDMAEQMIKSEHLNLYEEFAKNYDPKIVATTLLSTVKDLRRKGSETNNLEKRHFEDVFFALKKEKVSKEVIPNILEEFCEKPSLTVGEVIANLGIESVNEQELRFIIRGILSRYPQLLAERKIGALMGDIMKEVKGKIDGGTVRRILEDEIKKGN